MTVPNIKKIRQQLRILSERQKHKDTMSHAYYQLEGIQGVKAGRGEGGNNKKLKRKIFSNSEAAFVGQTG
jgi:hypothetical protein